MTPFYSQNKSWVLPREEFIEIKNAFFKSG